jgi:hypothetical protein
MAKMMIGESNGCWIDLFPGERVRGKSLRLHGPADFPMLRIGAEGFGETLASLRVGPHAYVQCFDSSNFDDSVFWLLPNEQVDDLSKLRSAERVNSIRLWDRPPFAHEPGYAAYMLWAASKVARAG